MPTSSSSIFVISFQLHAFSYFLSNILISYRQQKTVQLTCLSTIQSDKHYSAEALNKHYVASFSLRDFNMGILVLVEQKNLKSLDIEDLIYDCMEWHKGIPITDRNEYRRSVFVDLRIHIPEKLLQLNEEIRTVLQATNNYDNLKFYLYFSEPVLNSSAEILNSHHKGGSGASYKWRKPCELNF
ncbi:hypothetical protein DKX38_020402 [Salix brachista]|uniref:Uncharacterized protein n=1 Tax=Salix brachista TaxID=2182728 RepID=A0A5N5KAP0_9ROSI|nr:hypothetical protein DKX38_020402 [Salix brachista]